ncbi:SRPBCC family protein [Leptobacterium flavescens]|uniref:SRPBCC family protein n=1 Tax=Leptobacterium flavescens TaxID=472055 RepID=A0A6P0UKE6_9FLAO|nr:SRPBCC family protein [Leptobacterium flavescens]NER12358.1 SRPBCC family protein [Leptobacterium flavescens]
MNITSPKTTVNKSAQELFDLLTDVKNFERLMPDSISKFEVLEEGKFIFALKGMPEITLQLKEMQAPNKIVLGAAGDKLPFTLTADINEIAENKSEAQLTFEGDFNPMMAMMIKGPITSFIGTLSEKMGQL